eukprot:PhM_4_TR8042/c0_g1_i1/m.106615
MNNNRKSSHTSSATAAATPAATSSVHYLNNVLILESVVEVGNNFMRGCESLDEIYLHFPRCQVIGDACLSQCRELQTFEACGIPDSLDRCVIASSLSTSSLKGMDLRSVVSVGKDFLSQCASLRLFRSVGFDAITSIGDGLLIGCPTLAEVDISDLKERIPGFELSPSVVLRRRVTDD